MPLSLFLSLVTRIVRLTVSITNSGSTRSMALLVTNVPSPGIKHKRRPHVWIKCLVSHYVGVKVWQVQCIRFQFFKIFSTFLDSTVVVHCFIFHCNTIYLEWRTLFQTILAVSDIFYTTQTQTIQFRIRFYSFTVFIVIEIKYCFFY